MCGITGILRLDGSPASGPVLKRMTDCLAHRGPDGEGVYTDGYVGLGHRRLAVIDLSPAGQQPMANETGDVVVTYNGEVFNYQKLSVELRARGHRFRSATDTEVIVHGYEEWGRECLQRFNGMFAFAIWDRNRQQLFLARDRYGVKPLYYYSDGSYFIFASEIKALLVHPAVSARLCYGALNEYFTFQNIYTDRTLFDGIKLLPPGCALTVTPGRPDAVHQERYWDYAFQPDTRDLSMPEAAEELSRLVTQAVSRQLVADVPVGAYLSGGIDSGAITAVAAREIPRMYTFTLGFDLSSVSGLELGFDERAAAEILCNKYKTEHYEAVLHAGDMAVVLPELIRSLEDLRVGMCYPNYYVARLAGKFVKVVLAGVGGDELFAGYPWRYQRGLDATGPDGYFQAYYDYWQRIVPAGDRELFYGPDTYRQIRDEDPFDISRSAFGESEPSLETPDDIVAASLYFEAKTFLHGLFLVEDRLSMAHGLEARVPFMDNDLVDFAMRLPARLKLQTLNGSKDEERSLSIPDGKQVLRHAMSGLLPDDILSRPKQGFSSPDASWFRGESIDYVQSLLQNPRASIYEFIDPGYVKKTLAEHCSGQANHRLAIWSLLGFEWWCREFL